ncbi:MAG: N-acetyltransferase [Flavipsychrobacter sp.]|jgi:predicted GNAT family acetyltransferase|nr:N-acetyltransferase [Flavipsychrobacter sp.]
MEVVNNKRQYRFEIELPSGEIARLEYRWLKGNMVLMHTLVPASERGKGIGALLAKHVLEHARAHNLKVIVYCPFVELYVKKHPEYGDLIVQPQKK